MAASIETDGTSRVAESTESVASSATKHTTKPNIFKKLFRKLSRSSLKGLGSNSASARSHENMQSKFSPTGSPQKPNRSDTLVSDNHEYSFSQESDDRGVDEHSDGELDLHEIILDEDADVFSHHSANRDMSLLPGSGSNQADILSLLSNISSADLSFPKYLKATRKNNKSPRVFNNLFLAQELRCSPRPPQANSELSSVSDVNSDDDDNASTAFDSGQWDDTKAPMNPHEILVMEFSRDGKYLAVAGRDLKITIWQVISLPLSRLKYRNSELSKDSDLLKKLKLKVFAGAPVFLQEPVRVFEGHTKSVLCLNWSKNNFLLSGSMDKTVKLWNIERLECLDTFQHQDFVTALRFHPNDDRFFISGALDNQLRLWSILEHSVAYTNDLGDNALITALEFTPFGNYCLVGGFNGSLFALETQGLHLVKRIELRRKIKTHLGHSANGTTVSGIKIFENPTCADLPNSDLAKWNVLITTNDSTIRLVDLSLRKLVTRFRGNSNQSSSIVASTSEDSRYIISGSEDHYCYVWDNNNSIINNKLRASMKELLLESKNLLNEKHKTISKLLHDNKLWRKIPIHMFLEDENGKKYIANDNTSYSSFHANHSRVNVALFAPEKTKRLLQFSDDAIFDLVKRGTILAGTNDEKMWGSDHIIITSDVTGLIRVFRQDLAFYIRKNLLELKKMQKRDRGRKRNSSLSQTDFTNTFFDMSPKNGISAQSKSPPRDNSSIRSKLQLKIRAPYPRAGSMTSTRELPSRARLTSDVAKYTLLEN